MRASEQIALQAAEARVSASRGRVDSAVLRRGGANLEAAVVVGDGGAVAHDLAHADEQVPAGVRGDRDLTAHRRCGRLQDLAGAGVEGSDVELEVGRT